MTTKNTTSKKPKKSKKVEEVQIDEEMLQISAIDAIRLKMEQEQLNRSIENEKKHFELDEKMYALQLKTSEKELERFEYEKNIYNTSCLTTHGFHPEKRLITITEEIDDSTFNLVNDALLILSSTSDEPITIRISSCGGGTWEAAGICGLMRNCNCQIITEVFGVCMSAGILLLAAGDYRRVSRYSYLMDHSTALGLGYAKIADHRSSVEREEKDLERWNQWIGEFTGMEPGAYAKLTSDKRFDTHFTPAQALEWGLCDEVF